MFHRCAIPEVEIYRVLSNSRRRETLAVLWTRSDTVTLRELSETIAAAEYGEMPAPRPLRESVYNALHQTHLPKLDELGLVSYDPIRKSVRSRPAANHLGRYMDVMTRAGISWGEYYRTLGVFGLFATVTSMVGVPGFAAVDPLVPATIFLGLFAVSTGYQLTVASFGLRGRLAQLRNRIGR